jgi:hypothetical protein
VDSKRRSHGEQVPPVQNSISSIRAITANAANAKLVGYNLENKIWLKPRCIFVKVNVDATIIAEECYGCDYSE